MHAYYADHFVLPLPEGHRFPMRKYSRLRDRLHLELSGVRFAEAPAASDGELALVHTPAYIQGIAQGTLDAAVYREIGFPWSPAMAERARRSVGASLAAARMALSEGLAGNLAGGTHHAYADKGGGFCVFNDIAVTARLMQAEAWRQRKTPFRVAVIDLDVHQGNGTAHIFARDASVFTLSKGALTMVTGGEPASSAAPSTSTAPPCTVSRAAPVSQRHAPSVSRCSACNCGIPCRRFGVCGSRSLHPRRHASGCTSLQRPST